MADTTIQHGTGPGTAIFVSPETAGALLGITRTKIYDLLREGELASVRLGKRRLIARASVSEWAQRQLAAAGFESEGG